MASTRGELRVSAEEFLYYARRALDGMCEIVTALGDDLANRRPGIPGANTPYSLVVHCLGVVDYRSGHVVCGRASSRDRAAEFHAEGPVAVLPGRIEEGLAALERDLLQVRPRDPLRNPPDPANLGPGDVRTQASAFVHVLEELVQHHGQMQVLRDALYAEYDARRQA
jgi:Protein of unknown function (DUF664)